MRWSLAFLLCAACANPVTVPVDGGALDGSGGDLSVLLSPTGIDTRPSNTTCLAKDRPPSSSDLDTQPVYSSVTLATPIFALQAPNDPSRWFVVQKNGVVRVFANVATPAATNFISITNRVNNTYSESGLLGMAFAPDFVTSGVVYLSYTANGAGGSVLTSRLSRFRSLDGGATLDPDSEQILLAVPQPAENHNGGNLAFGSDGYLYWGLGDGGGGGDPFDTGQDLNALLAKLLRLDVSALTADYDIPADNPYAQGGGRPEIYAWGLRNPWRFSFDRDTGELWLGDVGQNQYEEIDRIVKGGNYGWSVREGLHCYNAMTCATQGFIDPIVEYDHSLGVSVTGGYVYRGSAMPWLSGVYIFGDYSSGRIWGVFFDDMGLPEKRVLLDASGYNIASFVEGADGELYLLEISGQLVKLVPAAPAPVDNFPKKLSDTGCVLATDPTQPAAGLIPYDVASPLWSDGADKRRWLALPDGAKISVESDGDLTLPIGSVVVKEFSLAQKRIETRLMMRHADGGWAGYTYRWRDDGSDADLLAGAATATVGAQTWYFPGRDQCLRCHTAAAGRTLGLELQQLAGVFQYPDGRSAIQLDTFEHIGLFADAIGKPRPAVLATPSMDFASLDLRARSYLHSNCSFCHRPMGAGQGQADFRFAPSAAALGVCNVAPEAGTLGVAGAKLLVPGSPSTSLISLRMHALDTARMPPLASRVVDSSATSVVDAWIAALVDCP